MLAGKTALITGSTSGIGLATAQVLAENGANIVLHGLMSDEEGNALAKEFTEKYQVKAMFDGANLMDAEAISAFMDKAADEMEGIDILINNAGIQHTERVETFPADKWNAIIAINLSAAFHTTQNVLPYMTKNGWGRIINIASVHGLVASLNKSAYCAAKHGIVGFTKVVAMENAELGVTANAICPGFVDTPLITEQIHQMADRDGITFEQAKRQIVIQKQSLPDMMAPRQIGEYALFLCSDTARTITGASLTMDGGWTAQ